ncbi:MAG: hypothetical protein ACXW3U_09105, partial [Rhodoplanes sp.]
MAVDVAVSVVGTLTMPIRLELFRQHPSKSSAAVREVMVSPYQAAAGIQKERTSIFPLAVWSLFSVNASNVAAFCSAAAGCTKGRFFDRVSDKLSQLARFATNELVSFDL